MADVSFDDETSHEESLSTLGVLKHREHRLQIVKIFVKKIKAGNRVGNVSHDHRHKYGASAIQPPNRHADWPLRLLAFWLLSEDFSYKDVLQ